MPLMCYYDYVKNYDYPIILFLFKLYIRLLWVTIFIELAVWWLLSSKDIYVIHCYMKKVYVMYIETLNIYDIY